LIRILK